LEAYLDPASIRDANDLKVTIDTGASLQQGKGLVIGDFEFDARWPGASWKAISDVHGIPLGVTKHIYRYQGPVANLPTVSYSPFRCESGQFLTTL
jgi:hypothetical protein